MKYKNFNYSDKQEVLKLLNDDQNITEAIVGAVNGIDDAEWLEDLCLKYILHDDIGISRSAFIECNIARILVDFPIKI